MRRPQSRSRSPLIASIDEPAPACFPGRTAAGSSPGSERVLAFLIANTILIIVRDVVARRKTALVRFPPNLKRSNPLAGAIMPLGHGARGLRGVVVQVGASLASDLTSALAQGELERRLLEIGFVEGAEVEILHEGLIGRDPIGVRLDDMCVALRRREADAVLVRVEGVVAEAAE